MTVEELAELTPLPASLAYLRELSPGTDPYVVQAVVHLAGRVDPDRLRGALQAVSERHDLLRASIRSDKYERKLFVVLGAVEVPFAVEEMTAAGLRRGLDAELARDLDIASPPLMRARLFMTAADAATLCLTIHHCVIDGTSVSVLLEDLFQAYAGLPWELPTVPRYSDHLALVKDPESRQNLGAWRDALMEIDTPTLVEAGSSEPSHADRRIPTAATSDVLARVGEWSRSRGHTLRAAVDAAWALTLRSLVGSDQLVFGTVVSTRKPEQPGHDRMIGPYINTVPRVAVLHPGQQTIALLTDMENRRLRTLRAEDAGLAAIQRQRGIGPLFDTAVAFENYRRLSGERQVTDELRVRSASVRDATHYPLSLVVLPDTGTHLLVDERRVPSRQAHSIAELFARTFAQLPAGERQPVARLRRGAGDPPARGARDDDQSPVADFLEWARRTPDAPAASDAHRTLSYREAADAVQSLAAELVAGGTRPGSVVAVGAVRSVDLPVALLAVAAAGGAFLCLDLDAPREHLAHILRSAAPDLVLVDEAGDAVLAESAPHLPRRGLRPGVAAPRPDAALRWRGDQGFCVIFTSGSTGSPKGVLLTHARTSRTFEGLARANAVTRGSRWLSVSAISFDLALCELLIPLTVGAHGHVGAPGIGRDVDQLATLMEAWKPTMMSATPLLWGALLEERPAAVDLLSRAMTVGEAPPQTVVSALRRAVPAVTNGYGPTETTICASIGPLRTDTRDVGRINAGYQAHVLDGWLRPVPPYVPGELYVAGECLALGYLGASALTAERFVANPFAQDGSRMYRTGDIGSVDRLGVLSLAGRADGQVKIRGHRVELGEVEHALRRCGARDAACVASVRADGTSAIAAFVVGEELPTETWRSRLARILPGYMVPTVLLAVESLPGNTSGKVDRALLVRRAAEEFRRRPTEREKTGDDDPTVTAIIDEFASLLGRLSVSATSDFFALGGHSLSGAQLVSRLRRKFAVDIPAAALFEAPTPAALAQVVRTAKAAGDRPSPAHVRRSPLSASQRMVWLAERVLDQGSAYNGGVELSFPQPVDEAALARAIDGLRDRHLVLRTTFHPVGDDVEQRVSDQGSLELLWVTAPSGPGREPAIGAAFDALVARPFDLTQEPPVRVALAPWDGHHQRLLLVTHHIAVDGYSVQVLLTDLATLLTGRDLPPEDGPGARLQYIDYVRWMQAQAEAVEADVHWWGDHLRGLPESLPLPYRPGAENAPASGAARATARLPTTLHRALQGLAEQTGSTLGMVLQAGLTHVLTRLTGAQEVPMGIALSGRDEAEFDDIVGMFVNTAVLRATAGGAMSVGELVDHTRESYREVMRHRLAPFEAVAAELRPRRTDPTAPLFRVYTSQLVQQLPDAGVPFVVAGAVASSQAKFELSVDFVDRRGHDGGAEGIDVVVEHAANLFDKGFGEDLVDALTRTYGAFAAGADAPLPEVVTPTQLARLERWGNVGTPDRDAGEVSTCLSRIWANLADLGDRPALHDAARGESLSYADLRRRVSHVRERLASAGVGPGDSVGVLASDGAAALPALLATWSLRAGYTPLDPTSPRRSAGFVRDAQVRALVHEPGDVALATAVAQESGTSVVLVEVRVVDESEADFPAPEIDLDDTAYTLFTSGSTGAPKGALVQHRGTGNHLLAKIELLGLGKDDVVVQNAPLTFDVSLWQLLAALVVGGSVLCVDRATAADPRLLAVQGERHAATVLEVVPSFLRANLALGAGPGELVATPALRWLIVTGEALPTDLARAWSRSTPHVPLVNAYGPTECSDDVTHQVITHPADGGDVSVPIGAPIAGAVLRVLDARLRLAAPGYVGELYVEGPCVGAGYARNPARTAESYVASPFTPGARMYRTGDLVRWDETGRLTYVGRRDHQVKIRGQRVELVEVEAAVRQLDGVLDAAVVTRTRATGDLELVAFVMSQVSGAELMTSARATVPSAFVPAHFELVAQLPTTPAGKVDRQLLTSRATSAVPRRAEPGPVTTPQLRHVVAAFSAVLGSTVEPDDDFFARGGDSIRAIQLAGQLRGAGLEVSPNDVMRAPTPRLLAALRPAFRGREVTVTGRFPMPPSMRSAPRHVLHSPRFTQHVVIRVPDGVGDGVLERSISALRERHGALRLRLLDHGELVIPSRTEEFRLAPGLHACPKDPAVLQQAVRSLRERLDPTRGHVLAARVVSRGAGSGRVLVLVAHHAAIDAASWAILLSDLVALAESQDASLLPPAGSYREWVEALDAAVPEARLDEEFWAKQNAGASLLYPTDDPIETDRRTTGAVHPGAEVSRAVRTLAEELEVDEADVVYACVADAIHRSRTGAGQPDDPISMGIESSGRSGELGMPAAGVVGWVAATFPVLVPPPAAGTEHDCLRDLISTIHASRRAVPHGGLGFALAAHNAGEMADLLLDAPATVVNYLGAAGDEISLGDWALVPVDVDDALSDATVEISVRGGGIGAGMTVAWTARESVSRHPALRAFGDQLSAAFARTVVLAADDADRRSDRSTVPSAGAGLDLAFQPLVLLKQGDGVPLFCVHGGVGLSLPYLALTPYVADGTPVYGIQAFDVPVGTDTMAELAAHYIDRIRHLCGEDPVRLLGWSFGGSVAFEMACQLQEAGRDVAWLGVLDQFPTATAGEHPPRAAVLSGLLGLLGYDVGEPQLSAAITDASAQRVLEAASQGALAGITPEQLEAIMQSMDRHYHLIDTFAPRVFEGDLHLVVALHELADGEPASELWEPYVTGAVRLYDVESDHDSILAMHGDYARRLLGPM